MSLNLSNISFQDHNNNLDFSFSLPNNISVSENKLVWILHQNIRSLRANSLSLFAQLSCLNIKPHIIFLTEVWIDSTEINFYNLDEYILLDCCNNDYRSGGVLAYVRNDIHFTFSSTHLQSSDILRVNFAIGELSFSVVCAYRLHSCAVEVFILEFENYLKQVNSKNLIVLGDMNINILNIDHLDSQECKYFSMMSSLGLESLINEPTRVISNSMTCIDHIFTRSKIGCTINYIAETLNLELSDHYMTSLKFNLDWEPPTKIPRQQTFINLEELERCLQIEPWKDVFEENDPSKSFDIFLSTLSKHMATYTTSSVISYSSNYAKPWINNVLLGKIRRKNALSKICKKHPNNTKLKSKIKTLSKQIKLDCETARKNYYVQKFEAVSFDQKKQWNLLNDLLGKRRKSNTINSIIGDNNTILTDSVLIANQFNQYFANIGKVLKTSITSTSCTNYLNYDEYNESNFFFFPTDIYEICTIISTLKNKIASGSDGISSFVIKKFGYILCLPLVHIFNNSFIQGIFPAALKKAVVIPLFKGGDANLVSNYRPISLLSVFSKILEKCVKARVLSYLNKINFISQHQYGFREGLSTENALMELLTSTYNNLNEGRVVNCLFIDVKKAFDTVDHNLLITKLSSIGIRGVTNRWFRSYLEDRIQICNINGNLSSIEHVQCGVPQGSVLGPLLFLIYSNSILELNLYADKVAFADDVALIYSGASSLSLSVKITHDLRVLRAWFDHQFMIVSDKSKIIQFQITNNLLDRNNNFIYSHATTCQNNSNINFTDNNCSSSCVKIDYVDSFKYLGVTLDKNLNFKMHINILQNHLFLTNRVLFRLKPLCPQILLKNLYYSLVQSRLSYGICCWGGIYYSNLKRLHVSQKFILRNLYNAPRNMSSKPLFRKANILTIRNLYIFKVLKLFFIRSGNRHFKESSYPLRNKYCVVPASKKEFFRRFYVYTAPMLFNQLPNNIKSINNINPFLKSLRAWLIELDDSELLFKIMK